MPLIRPAQRSPYQGHRRTGSAGPLVSPPGRGEQTTRQCVWTGVGTFFRAAGVAPWKGGDRLHAVSLGGGGHILGWAHS